MIFNMNMNSLPPQAWTLYIQLGIQLFCPDCDFQYKYESASTAALNEPDFSVSRNPTDIWSGFGLSRSVPANVWKMEKEEIKKIEERRVTEEPFPDLMNDSAPCYDLPALLTKYG